MPRSVRGATSRAESDSEFREGREIGHPPMEWKGVRKVFRRSQAIRRVSPPKGKSRGRKFAREAKIAAPLSRVRESPCPAGLSCSNPPGRPAHPVPISADQGFLLGPAPAFQAPLIADRVVDALRLSGPDKFDRQARSRIARDQASLMLADALVEIGRTADVIGPVGASKHVGPGGHGRNRTTRVRPLQDHACFETPGMRAPQHDKDF